AAWAGLRPFSHDNLPYLGGVPGLEGAYAATGHYRSGILLAPITAQLVADIIAHRSPSLPTEPYALTRLLDADAGPAHPAIPPVTASPLPERNRGPAACVGSGDSGE